MKKLPITPEQIKTIASAIRARECEKLNANLPNTTVLNAVVKALGIGPDYRTFKAGFDKAKQPSQAPSSSHIIFLFEHSVGDEEVSSKARDALISEAERAGMLATLESGANGFSVLHIMSLDPTMTLSALEQTQARIRKVADDLIADMEIAPIEGSMFWQSREDEPNLIVNFRYHDNDQIASMYVHESAWRARHQLGLSDEAATIVLGGDCDIDPGYTPSCISTQDVMREAVFFNE